MWRKVAFLLWLAAAPALLAQQFDIFDLNDFVDPRLHGAEFDDKLQPARFTGGSNVVITRLTTGAVANYWWQDRPSGADVRFTRVSTAFYGGSSQTTLTLDRSMPNVDGIVPAWRGTISYGSYGATRTGNGKDESSLDLDRSRVYVTLERNPLRSVGDRTGRPLNFETGVETDVSFGVHGQREIGTLSLATRFAGSDHNGPRIGYLHHYAEFGNFVRVNIGLGIGIEKAPHWAMGMRPTARFTIPVPFAKADVHVIYGASGMLRSGRRGGNEVSVFFDKAVLARIR